MTDMERYQEYVFEQLRATGVDTGAQPGALAPQWKAAMEALPGLGFGVNPKPGEVQPEDAPHHGVTVMIDAGGNARGRIWLPTDVAQTDANGNRWFTHEIQLIADSHIPGTLKWDWDDKGGPEVREFTEDGEDGDGDEGEGPGEPPPSDLAALEARVKTLEEQYLVLIPRVETVEQLTTPESIHTTVQGQQVQVRGSMGFRDVATSREVTWTGQVGTLPAPKSER